MPCLTTLPSLLQVCPRYGMGGVRAVWIALRSEVEAFYVDDTYTVSEDSDGKFRRIPGRGSFQSVAQVNEDTGLTYYRDELTFTPDRLDPLMSGQLLAELQSASPDDLIVFAETWIGSGDGSGDGYGYGYVMGVATKAPVPTGNDLMDAPVFFSGGQIVTGTEKTDANGHSFGFTSVHPFPALSCYLHQPSNPSTD